MTTDRIRGSNDEDSSDDDDYKFFTVNSGSVRVEIEQRGRSAFKTRGRGGLGILAESPQSKHDLLLPSLLS